MPFFTRSLQQLTSDSLEELSRNTNLTKMTPGGKARALLESVNKRLEEAYETFDINLARAFVSAAPGQYLDLIGELLGVSRESSAAASADLDSEVVKFYVATGTFGDINSGSPIVIPQGTTMSTSPNDTGILYKTTAEVTLGAAENARYVGAEALIPGEGAHIGANTLNYHSFTTYVNYLDRTLKVTNLHPISNGRNFESDANFRFRIINRVLEAEAANETALRLAALTTPGVADVLMIQHYRGIGTFAMVIQSAGPTVTSSLIDQVTARVFKAQAYGDLAYIMKPKETGLVLRFTVWYRKQLSTDALDQIEDQLKRTIETYISELGLGDPFIPNKLISELFSVSQEVVNFGETGKPIDEMYLYKETRLGDGKRRELLLGDYYPSEDERVILEPSVTSPVVFMRKFGRR